MLKIISFVEGANASRELKQVLSKQSTNSLELSASNEVVTEEKRALRALISKLVDAGLKL